MEPLRPTRRRALSGRARAIEPPNSSLQRDTRCRLSPRLPAPPSHECAHADSLARRPKRGRANVPATDRRPDVGQVVEIQTSKFATRPSQVAIRQFRIRPAPGANLIHRKFVRDVAKSSLYMERVCRKQIMETTERQPVNVIGHTVMDASDKTATLHLMLDQVPRDEWGRYFQRSISGATGRSGQTLFVFTSPQLSESKITWRVEANHVTEAVQYINERIDVANAQFLNDLQRMRSKKDARTWKEAEQYKRIGEVLKRLEAMGF